MVGCEDGRSKEPALMIVSKDCFGIGDVEPYSYAAIMSV